MQTTVKVRVYGGVVQNVEFWGDADVQVLVYDYDVEAVELTENDVDEEGEICTLVVYDRADASTPPGYQTT